jgi:hypothetical protein
MRDTTISGGADSIEMDYNSLAGMSDQMPINYRNRNARANMTSGGSMRFRKKMSPLPNMSTTAMLDRRAETKRENLSKSRNRLSEIAK